MIPSKDSDPAALTERHMRIFETSGQIFAECAFQTIQTDNVPIEEVLVFCVDVRSSWARLFTENPEDLEMERDLTGQEIPLYYGTALRSPFAEVMRDIHPLLASMVATLHHDQSLAKCLILDDHGVTVHHIQPSTPEERPKYLN